MAVDREQTTQAFLECLWRLGGLRAATLLLIAPGLMRSARRRGAAAGKLEASATPVDKSLQATFGACDDALRRGAVAAMAATLLGQPTTFAGVSDADAALGALARRLARSGGYDPAAYSADAALASGLVVPLPPFRVVVPPLHQPEGPPVRLRKTLASGVRVARRYGGVQAWRVAARAWRGAWAELHLDLRACSAFHGEGFDAAYRTLAAFLQGRPDLAGLRAASWLYDPELARISPGLGFVRASAEAGGALFVPVRTDPIQRAFAAARSPERQALIASGAYRPACYAMSWLAEDLIAWADRRGPARSPALVAA